MIATLQIRNNAFKGMFTGHPFAAVADITEINISATAAIQNDLADIFR